LTERVGQTNGNEYNVTDDENYDDSEYTEVQELKPPLQIIGESPTNTSKLDRRNMPRLN
jgi:hypothetical protein